MLNTWEDLGALAASTGGRIVSSNDLHEFQIAQLRADGAFFVDPVSSYGWGLLPWDLTTDQDRGRERKYLIPGDIEHRDYVGLLEIGNLTEHEKNLIASSLHAYRVYLTERQPVFDPK